MGAGESFGRLTAFHGQMGMFVRALTYMLSHGGDGLAQAARDAVLNANYIKARLEHVFSAPFGDGPCMHEALFDDSFLEGTGVSTLDFAKAMIDEGFHPMTMYFPLVVHGAMLIEPTEMREQAGARPLLRCHAGARRGGEGRRRGALHRSAPDARRAAGSTRPAPPARRASNGRRPTCPRRRNSLGIAARQFRNARRGAAPGSARPSSPSFAG